MSSRLQLTRTAYSLLAIASAVVLVTTGGCGAKMTPEQQSAMTTVRAAGGRVFYESGGYRVDLSSSRIEDDDLQNLYAIPDLTSVDLRGTQVTDAAIPYLQKISALKNLNIERTAITPEAVAALKKAKPDLNVEP
jgi:hypothetical protein